ncbi:uncharacterized protein [Palaemon carinicauda]|uniref:uncharacterized protein n=1 Tax=Palaemon carinicauda TaxID=392227 RepID=UPI0035B58276
MESDVLTTGNVKMDRLLANLEKPTERSKAIWMALLHDLVSNGSVNDLLGNFIRESASQVKREDPLFQETDGQEHLEEQLPDQLGGPGSPLTQMEEFILEPHLGPAIMPFQLPKGFFVSFIPRRAFGVVNGVARPPHGHGSFYNHRPPGLVDVINPPAYGYNFNGYRRFDPDATIYDDYYYYDDEPVADEQQQQ